MVVISLDGCNQPLMLIESNMKCLCQILLAFDLHHSYGSDDPCMSGYTILIHVCQFTLLEVFFGICYLKFVVSCILIEAWLKFLFLCSMSRQIGLQCISHWL